MSLPAYKHQKDTSSNDVELFEIAHKMKIEKLPDSFISAAVKTGMQYEGVSDLLKLWFYEDTAEERNEIIADIQELIEDCQLKTNDKVVTIKINDLDAISKDIRKFKDSLLCIVDQKGGISHLAELTGIPQPSLSRFFNSNSMPRRITLLKIRNALKLETIEIDKHWAK